MGLGFWVDDIGYVLQLFWWRDQPIQQGDIVAQSFIGF